MNIELSPREAALIWLSLQYCGGRCWCPLVNQELSPIMRKVFAIADKTNSIEFANFDFEHAMKRPEGK